MSNIIRFLVNSIFTQFYFIQWVVYISIQHCKENTDYCIICSHHFEKSTVILMTWFKTVTEYLYHRTTHNKWRSYSPDFLSSFITFHPILNKSNTTGVICGAGIVYSSFFGVVFSFLCNFYRPLFVMFFLFVRWFLVIVLSVFWFMASGCYFGVLILF